MLTMGENQEKIEKVSYQRLADAYGESLTNPKLRQGLINNLSKALDSDEKTERFAKESKVDPDELKELLKKPQ